MPWRSNRWCRVAIKIVIAGSIIFTPAAVRAGSVVDHAEIHFSDQYADIEIKFHAPINIGAYAPTAHGELLQVNVELPVGIELSNAVQLGSTEWIAGSQPSAATLYDYLRFDRTNEPTRGRIVIKFLHDIDFTVSKSADSRSVVISILRASLPKSRPEKLGRSNLLPETAHAQVNPPIEKKSAIIEEPIIPMTVIASAPTLKEEPQNTNTSTTSTEKPNSADPGNPIYAALPDYSLPTNSEPTPASPSQLENNQPSAVSPPLASSSKGDGWRVYGGFTQYYNYSDVKISRSGDPRFNTNDSQVSQNDLRTYLDMSARYRDEDWDVRSRFGGGYRNDFIDHSQDNFVSRYAGNKVLLSDAYVDVRNRHNDMSAKVGRQYGNSGGVFGRFDGAQVGMPIGGDWRANVVVGSPVDLIYDKTVDDTNSYFYGANMDFAPKGSHWQYNFYVIQQMIDGIVDRRALGNETRYYGEGRSLLTLLDYDVEYNAVNRALAIGTWNPFKQTTLSATLDYGASPLLTTRNALISQPDYSSIKQMQRIYSNSEIEQLARDRTADYHNVLVSVTQQLNELTQLYGSIGQYYYGSMRASGGVEAMPATGNEYDYTLQYIRSSLLQTNDTHSFSLRYYDGFTARRTAVGVDARYAWGNWRINPRLWIERRNNLSDGSSEWVYRPGVNIEYSFARRYHLEFNASSDIYQGKIPEVGSQDIVGNFVQIGYRIDLD